MNYFHTRPQLNQTYFAHLISIRKEYEKLNLIDSLNALICKMDDTNLKIAINDYMHFFKNSSLFFIRTSLYKNLKPGNPKT